MTRFRTADEDTKELFAPICAGFAWTVAALRRKLRWRARVPGIGGTWTCRCPICQHRYFRTGTPSMKLRGASVIPPTASHV